MSYLRNHKLLLLIIGVLLVANIALLYLYVFNKEKKQPHRQLTEREMRDKAKQKVVDEVGFTAEQATVYDSLRNQQFKVMKPLFKGITQSKEDFFSLIYQEGVNDSMLNSYASKIGEKQMELDVSTFHYFQSIKALCTEDQKPKMDSFIKQIVKRIINNGGPPRRPSPDKKENK